MKEIAGFIRFDGATVDADFAVRIARAINSAGKPGVWRPDPSCVFVEGRDSAESPPVQRREDRTLLVDARLDCPADLARELALDWVPDSRALCVAACDRWGIERAIPRLYGDVVLAEWDVERRRLTIARDPFSVRTVFYVETPRYLLFASTLQLLLMMPETPREIDDVALAHTLTLGHSDPETTVYRGVRRAPAGATLTFEAGRRTVSRWFGIESIRPVRLSSDDAYVEAARALLDQAVACRLPASGRVAAQLSGGFDSGGVVATAARLLGDTGLDVYTRVAGDPAPQDGFDERHLAGLLVARYPSINWRVLEDAADVDRDMDFMDETRGAMLPIQASYNLPWFRSLRRLIEQSSPAALFLGGLGNYTLSYAGEPNVMANLARGRFGHALGDVRGIARDRKWSLSRAFVAALYNGVVPESLRRWRSHRISGARPWLSHCVASPDFLDALDYGERAREHDHDLPFRLRGNSVARRLRLIQAQEFTDFRGKNTRKWSTPIRQPYRDRRLIEFCLGIPDDQYWRNGQSRWLARRVLADRVPAETLAKHGQGRQVPEWHAIGTRRLDTMIEEVERIGRSPLASRVLDVPRMRALLESWPRDAESAHETRLLHNYALSRGIAMGEFLRWHEGRND